ncbi:hypothetical protein LCGC14_1617950 [marine sediment metagenome]|uniref:Uncharacterized protein n=1 Tax=marine sediment metagenome TaxID=412755 RepID=A0A0F9IT76_9ZZZZ
MTLTDLTPESLAKTRKAAAHILWNRKYASDSFEGFTTAVIEALVEAEQRGRKQRQPEIDALNDQVVTSILASHGEGEVEGARAEHDRMLAAFDTVTLCLFNEDRERLRAALDAAPKET